jgi:hypothetical protein
MLNFCILREFRVVLVRAYDDQFRAEMRARVIPGVGKVGLATVLIDHAERPEFPRVAGTLQEMFEGSLPLLCRASRIAAGFTGWRTSCVVFADVGQWPSTLALASQISGGVFPDGLPGAVWSFKPAAGPVFVQLTTRDRDSVAANALVIAAALALAKVVVLPIGLPADTVLRPLMRAIQDFSRLMLLPIDMRDIRTRALLLIGPRGARELEGLAAERLVSSILCPVLRKGTTQGEDFTVKYTSELGDILTIIDTLCPTTLLGADEILARRVLAAFGTVNEFAEYLELD